jgi:hypothetical protein
MIIFGTFIGFWIAANSYVLTAPPADPYASSSTESRARSNRRAAVAC